MDLRELRANWDALGEQDAYSAILSDPARNGRPWDPDEFMRTGIADVERAMKQVLALRPGLKRERALDFGCGVGRLTQPLCDYFAECVGVDIAPSMIALARSMNRRGDACRYDLNDTEGLALYADEAFDFVLSFIVLQHMQPEYAGKYIREFVRVLRPGGLALFQAPSQLRPEWVELREPVTASSRSIPRRIVSRATFEVRAIRDRLGQAIRGQGPRVEMQAIQRDTVLNIVGATGARVLDVTEDGWAGKEWVSYTYVIERVAGP